LSGRCVACESDVWWMPHTIAPRTAHASKHTVSRARGGMGWILPAPRAVWEAGGRMSDEPGFVCGASDREVNWKQNPAEGRCGDAGSQRRVSCSRPVGERAGRPAHGADPVGSPATPAAQGPHGQRAVDLLAIAARLDSLVPHAGQAAAQIQKETAQLRRMAGGS
jgi:hypothetical protein